MTLPQSMAHSVAIATQRCACRVALQLRYAGAVTDADKAIAEFRIAERYNSWLSAQDHADHALEELETAIRGAASTRAWGIFNAIAALTGWSRERVRRISKTPKG